jgi:tetratricopeptide (TPR) repeat protein
LLAVEQFKTALRLDPQIPLGHYHLGFAYGSLGKNHEAVVEYETELRGGKRDAEVYYQLAHVQIELGDLQGALANDRAAIAQTPRADAYYDLGKALALLGDTTGAREALERSISLNPNDPSPHYQLSRVLTQLKQPAAAAQEMKRFTELNKMQQSKGGMATGRLQ